MPDFRALAVNVAQQYHLDPNIFVRQIQAESNFDPNARSPAGAVGLGQLMPATAQMLGVNPNDPVQNLHGAAAYMASLLHHNGGSYARALSAYNSGRPDAYLDPHFAGGQTYNYVKHILGGQDVRAPGSPAVTSTALRQVAQTVPDPAAEKRVVLANFLEKQDPGSLLLRLGVVSPNEATTRQVTKLVPSQQSPAVGDGPTRTSKGNFKIGAFEGTPVATWMIPALKYARAHGWTGKLTSGVRTFQQQAALYANRANNPNPVAKPGTSSHEIGNGGAFDATSPQQLAQVLKGFRGRRPVWAPTVGLNDPVHFSLSGR